MRPLAIVLAILFAMPSAHAEPAPTFAVGLRAKDFRADKIALSLEAALRTAGTKKSATYRSTTSRKQLVAALVAVDCMITESDCPAAAGAKLGVDYVLAGTIESRGKLFILDLDVIHVQTGKRVRSLREHAPMSTTAAKWARTIFTRVIDDATGDLVISSNAERGTVFVDGKAVTELFQRRATVPGLSLGTHAIEIRADGYKPYTDDVSVDGPTKMSVLLEAR